MEQETKLMLCLASVSSDERLTIRHIGVYIALVHLWCQNRLQNPFNITRQQVMRLGRIGSIATYHKCIKELESYGYISYIPSYNPYLGSEVSIN